MMEKVKNSTHLKQVFHAIEAEQKEQLDLAKHGSSDGMISKEGILNRKPSIKFANAQYK